MAEPKLIAAALSGVVVDESGAPVAGAKIGLSNDPFPASREWVSSAEGEFAIPVPDLFVGDLWAVSETATGSTTGVTPEQPCRIVMRARLADLTVTVFDDGGTPVAGACVNVIAPPATPTRSTNAAGIVRFDRLPAGYVLLRAQAVGFRVRRAVVQLRAAESRAAEIRLTATKEIVIECVDEQTGARVTDVRCFAGSLMQALDTTVDAAGLIHLPIYPDATALRAEATGYVACSIDLTDDTRYRVELKRGMGITVTTDASVPTSLVRLEIPWGRGHIVRSWVMAPGETRRIDALPRELTMVLRADAPDRMPYVEVFALRDKDLSFEIRYKDERRYAMPVRVVDTSTKHGIPGLRVVSRLSRYENASAGSLMDQHARTDADGAFRLQGVGGELYRVKIMDTSGRVEKQVDVTVIRREQPTVIEMQGRAFISGAVVDADKKPCSGVAVFAFLDQDRRLQLGAATSADDGSFRIEVKAPPDGMCTLVAVIAGEKRGAQQRVRVFDTGVVLALEERGE